MREAETGLGKEEIVLSGLPGGKGERETWKAAEQAAGAPLQWPLLSSGTQERFCAINNREQEKHAIKKMKQQGFTTLSDA